MLAVFARRVNPLSLSKAGYGIGLSSLLLLAGAGSVHDATALNDLMSEVSQVAAGKAPIQIISSYRSPATNAMLRRRSSGVARFSQHMLGHAMDFFIPGVPLEQIRFAGLRLRASAAVPPAVDPELPKAKPK